MGRSTCCVVARMGDYIDLKKSQGKDWKGLLGLVDNDELYEWLNSADGGIEFVDDRLDELDPEAAGTWYTRRRGLLVEGIEGDGESWLLRWASPAAKVEWFRPFYEQFRRDVDHYVNQNLDAAAFSRYADPNPPWKLGRSYERVFDGWVLILDGYGNIASVEYPMEFLRMLEPDVSWAMANKGILYKP